MKTFLYQTMTIVLSTFFMSNVIASSSNRLLNDSLTLRVYLQGALVNNGNLTYNGRPLMRDNLRLSTFTNLRYIPVKSPYAYNPYYSMMTDRYSSVGDQLDIIPDSTIFNISG